MSEAHPIDLNYGHLGEPIYDSNNQEWRFARQPNITRELRPLGQPILTLERSLIYNSRGAQSATQRSQDISDLTHQYPELLPGTTLLPGLAQISEAVTGLTSSHDPAVSELLAFGQAAIVEKTRRGAGTVPIAAIAGGAAGEAVRLVLLRKEQSRWEDSEHIGLSLFTIKGGEEGWWSGNGTPIQQLVFGDMDDEATPWLAVRYGGTISILQPLLQRGIFAPELTRPGRLQYPASRLDPNHVVTLPIQRSGGVPIVDVTFNPWDNQQIATLDQCSRWTVWDIEMKARKMGVWTIKRSMEGTHSNDSKQNDGESKIIADGWGAVLWAGDMNTIVVATRTKLAVYDIRDDPEELSVPNIFSRLAIYWILDVKTSPSDLNHVFVLTTSSIFWLHISTVRDEGDSKESKSGARCLLSWKHFRDPGDISLRMNIVLSSENTEHEENVATLIVLLYSRLRDLTTAYTLVHSTASPIQATSSSDPYILRLSSKEQAEPKFETGTDSLRANSQISAVVLKAVPYDSKDGAVPSGLGKLYIENNIHFHQLSVLSNDLALSESLYAALNTDFSSIVRPPDLRTRREVIKTPINVSDEFVVPNGLLDWGLSDSKDLGQQFGIHQRTQRSDQEILSESDGFDENPWTLSFEWLEEGSHELLSEPARTKPFDEVLEFLYTEIENILAIGNPALENLHHLAKIVVTVVDIDKASADLADLVGNVTKISNDNEDSNHAGKAKSVSISSLLPLTIQRDLGLEGQLRLSQVYEGLIKAWIAPLSLRIPARARIALEKLLRDLSAQLCLASHAVRVSEVEDDDVLPGNEKSGSNLEYALPMRKKVSASNLRKRKEPAARSSSPLASSQISEDVGFMPSSQLASLPTPEPTPSLHSQSSNFSLAATEDSASRRLQAYCSLTIQPSLPTKMSNLLSQWEVGGDPAKYDWEAAQQALISDESEDELRARQRQRKERRRRRQRQDIGGSSSQPQPKTLGASQQQALETQKSSQPTQSLVTASQPEPGRFGGPLKPKKKKFGSQSKRPGF